jgi:hypothetical protein
VGWKVGGGEKMTTNFRMVGRLSVEVSKWVNVIAFQPLTLQDFGARLCP